MKRRRESTEQEFARTVHMINERAKELGVEADFDEDWEKLATNGDRTEGENLEARNTTGITKE